MSRLIDADKMRDEWLYESGTFEPNDVLDSIDYQPTIDAVEVVHGYWEVVDQEEPRRYGCSVCRRLSFYQTNYCSYCGAKMDGERKEKSDDND